MRPPGNEKTGFVEHVPDDGDSGGVSERLDAFDPAKDCHVESVASAQDEATRAGGVADWDGEEFSLIVRVVGVSEGDEEADLGETGENWRDAGE